MADSDNTVEDPRFASLPEDHPARHYLKQAIENLSIWVSCRDRMPEPYKMVMTWALPGPKERNAEWFSVNDKEHWRTPGNTGHHMAVMYWRESPGLSYNLDYSVGPDRGSNSFSGIIEKLVSEKTDSPIFIPSKLPWRTRAWFWILH